MKHYILPSARFAAFCLFIALLLFCTYAHAQTVPGTRVTPCSATTPNDAICFQWKAVVIDVTGTQTISGAVYRVSHKTGANGAYSNMATGIAATQFYAQNLSLGQHFFRVYASCPTCTVESDPSNEVNGTATAVPLIPAAPVVIIAATIRADGPPIYRVIQSVTLKPNEIAFVAPASMRPLFANR